MVNDGDIDAVLIEVSKRQALRDQANEDVARLNSLLCDCDSELKRLVEVCEVLKISGELLREKIRQRVESLVTMALRSVFERDDYEFVLDMSLKRGQMVAEPMIVSDFGGKKIKAHLMDAHGGGLVNVTSFVLRTVVLVLTRPRLDRIMVLDETFRNVSRRHLPKVAELLKKLHEITGVQIIMVTHKPELADVADKVFEVTKTNGITEIKGEEGQ